MIAATALPEVKTPLPVPPAPFVLKKAEQPEPKFITWHAFERRYLSREDKFKYEWVNGEVVKTARRTIISRYHPSLHISTWKGKIFWQSKKVMFAKKEAMSTAATTIQPTAPPAIFPVVAHPASTQPVISWEEFEREYLSREDEYKYEWVEGRVVKTKRSMNKTQLYILDNLLDFFELLKFEGKISGHLFSEPDLFFLTNHHHPDIVWMTKEQMRKLADPKAYEVPAFIIEVVSTNDQINELKDKMKNYRDAGVQVVWQIYPKQQEVEIYSGKNLAKNKVCFGRQICSAAPVLPAFAMPASAIFKK